MSNLVPEKRVNKNGVAVTKHVRAAPKTSSSVRVPAPALKASERPAKAKRKPLTKKQLEVNYNSLIRVHFNASEELTKTLLGSYGKPKMTQIYVFTCSDAEIYDVISVAGLDNAGALLNAGFRNRDDVEAYLSEQGLSHLIQDESSLTGEALVRGVPAQYLFESYQKHFSREWDIFDESRVLDTAEALAHKGLRNAKVTPTIPERVSSGTISMNDIRTVGATRLLNALENNGFLLSQLAEIKAGEVDYGAQEFKEAIERYSDSKGSVSAMNVRGFFAIARVCGYEEALKIRHPIISSPLVSLVEGTTAEKLQGVHYADDVYSGLNSSAYVRSSMIYEAYRAGANVEQAISYIDGEMTMQQIEAINDEGIVPSVSGGWL